MAKYKTPAVVFGLFETGLAVIRALGRAGIKVISVDYKKDIGWYSKYSTPMICPNPIEKEEAFLKWIEDHFSDKNPLPVFFTGDDFLYPFSRNRERLSAYFVFNLPKHQELLEISDKYDQYHLAKKAEINVPRTWAIDTPGQLKPELFQMDCWPLILKGREVNSWRAFFGGTTKGFKINNFRELQEKAGPALTKNLSMIAQEVITGPDTNHFKYCAYRTATGKILAEFCLQKLRQYPIRFGIGSLVVSIYKQDLINTGRKFLQNIDYHGIGSAEFKYDQKDGQLKLIELNPRYWQQNTLAEACGINFPLINYMDLLALDIEKTNPPFQTGLKWVNLYMDFAAFLDYHKAGELSFKQWLTSLKGPRVFSDFAWDDIIPGFWEIRFGKRLIRLPRKLMHLLRQKKSIPSLKTKTTAHV